MIQNKSFDFALHIIDLYKKLVDQKEYIVSKQLFKSATSIGTNIEEALEGESRKDFVHKISIAKKEARATRYWLNILDKGQLVDNINLNNLLNEVKSIINILTKITKTTTEKSNL